MSRKRPSDFPFAKPTAHDRRQAQEFFTWLIRPFATHTEILPGQSKKTAVFRALNGAAIGFALSDRTVDLVYLKPGSLSSPIMVTLNHGVTEAWMRGELPDKDFHRHRSSYYQLPYRLSFWRHIAPDLYDKLGCASDIRFVARVTVALNYEIPNLTPAETPENHSLQLELPSH